MSNVRSSSALGDAQAIMSTYRLIERGRLLGVVDAGEPVELHDVGDVAREAAAVADRLATAGVGRAAAALVVSGDGGADAIERLLAAVDANPLPEREWQPLRHLLGDELLGLLVNVSQSSLGRYASGTRPTPDLVAGRLHVVAMVCADLRGAYNDYGMRRWFVRPRPSLEGGSIVELLGTAWDPDGVAATKVRELAASVLSVGAT
jgi:hypothetical protein